MVVVVVAVGRPIPLPVCCCWISSNMGPMMGCFLIRDLISRVPGGDAPGFRGEIKRSTTSSILLSAMEFGVFKLRRIPPDDVTPRSSACCLITVRRLCFELSLLSVLDSGCNAFDYYTSIFIHPLGTLIHSIHHFLIILCWKEGEYTSINQFICMSFCLLSPGILMSGWCETLDRRWMGMVIEVSFLLWRV